MKLLLDENLPIALRTQLRRRLTELVVWRIGDIGAPPFGTLDPPILEWCEENGFHLVTDNRASMPAHLADHLASGRHVPGIFNIQRSESMGVLLDELQDIVELSLP